MEKLILALDQGTTSCRAILFAHDGSIRSLAQQEFTQYYPQPGWVEHDGMEIWDTQLSVAREAIARAAVDATSIGAIGITNQRETTLVWDRSTGRPVCPALVWQDRRTAAFCDELRARGYSEMVREKTGLVIDPYFSGTKLKWILDHIPGVKAAALKGLLAFGTMDSWLLWNLTGGRVHATDPSNASRTMLYNIHDLDWDEALLGLLEIPREILPELRSSSEIYGHSSRELFGTEIPVSGIAGDQQAALFGQGCTRPGLVKNTYGTGCFLVMQTGKEPVSSSNQLLSTIAWQILGETSYALEGSIFIGGAVVQWLRDGLGLIGTASGVEQLAAADNGGICLVPAFTGLGAPHWDPHARGMVTGISRGTTKAHLARAALESIAFQTMDVLGAMESDCGSPILELRVDGGATSNNLLMQFQADILGVPVVRPRVTETTALGAAFLAGIATGFWKDAADLQGAWKEEHRFLPQMEPGQASGLKQEWRRAVRAARSWSADRGE